MLKKIVIVSCVLSIVMILLVGTFYFKSKDSNLLLQDSSLNSNNQYNVLEGSGDKLNTTKELKNITVLSSNDTIEAYEIDKKVRTLSQGSFIGHGPRDFECTTIIQDEILVECEQINDTAIRMIQSFVNESSLSKDYQWKIGIETDDEKYIVSENRTKENITKDVIINIPYGTSKITYTAGVSSTTIDAVAPNDATREVGHDKMCRLIDGTLVVAYEGSGSDIYVATSGDNGATWNTNQLRAGTTAKANIQCAYNNSVSVSWIESGNLYYSTLGTGATSFGNTPVNFYDTGETYIWQKCIFDEHTYRHCIVGDSGASDNVYYVNETNGGIELTGVDVNLLVVGGIDKDSNGNIWLMAGHEGDDTFYLWNTVDGMSSPISAYNVTPSTINSLSRFSFRIYNVNGTDVMMASITEGTIVKIINSTVGNNATWSNITADSTGGFESAFALTPKDNRIEVVSSDGSLTSTVRQLYRANSTPSKDTFDSGQSIETSGANYPDLLDGPGPWTTRLRAYKGISEYVYSDDGGDIFFDSVSIPVELLPFNLTLHYPNTTDPYDAVTSGLNMTLNYTLIDLDNRNWIYNLTYNITVGGEIANVSGIWQVDNFTLVNISMPNFTSGLKDLYINITYDTANISILESEVVSYGVAANSCTYTSGNWNFDFCDICNITEDVNLGGNILNGTQSEACNDGAFNILGANITNVGGESYQCTGTNKCNVRNYGGSLERN